MNFHFIKTTDGWKSAGIILLLLTGQLQAAPVRITSWNLQPNAIAGTNGLSQQIQHNLIQEAAETLKKLNPDVILLQQAADWESCNQLAKALKPENYNVAICSAFRDSRSGASSRGQTAILSKSKAYISWSSAWQNSTQTIAAPGGFAFAAIRIGGKNIGFFSVQLSDGSASSFENSSSAPQQQAREEAARQLVQQINSLRNWTTNRLQAQLVAGDFNTSADDMRFIREKTLSPLEQFGFENAFAGLPLEKRVTLPGNGKRPDATVDYILAREAGQIANPQITQTALTEHAAVTCNVDLEAPKPTPVATPARAVVTASVKTAALETNHTASPPVALAKAVPVASKPQFFRHPLAFVAGGIMILAMVYGLLRLMRRNSRSTSHAAKTESDTTISTPPNAGRIVVAPAQNSPPFVHIEAESVTQTQSQSQVWQPRSEIIGQRPQRMADTAQAGLMAHLAHWLKKKFVQKLISDRAQLLDAQQTAALRVLAVDERLSKIERQIQQRNHEYEQRIDDLLKELAAAQEENRELIQAKIAVLKAEMEKNANFR